MTRDAKLDAFASTGETAEADSDEVEPADEEKTVASLATTSEWDPDGGECATCGAVVERRWRQDGALVCPDCKDWSEA